MNPLDQLITAFEHFPGVGARQAKRFAFHILRLQNDDARKLASLIEKARTTVLECASCHRYFSRHQTEDLCSICLNSNRNRDRLLVVERDSDVQAIEKAGVYDGLYFVLGGTVPLLSAPENSKLRSGALKATVAARIPEGLTEVILGFSVNPDGENTARFVASFLKEPVDSGLTLSYLGRGLSTGSELEYADSETIKNAFHNRA
jgi:recombination protein RecR